MLLHKVVHAPPVGKMPWVVDVDFALKDFNLNGDGLRVVFVNQRIKDGFTHCFTWEEIFVYPLDALVGDVGPQIFQIKRVHECVQLHKERSFEFVLVDKVGEGLEIA